MNNFKTVKLQKGEVNVYDFGAAKLHAYKTNDVMTDEVYILEKNGRAVVIEAPCFTDNIAELNEYIGALSSRTEALVLSYHMAGASFLPGVPVYSTKNADTFGHSGGGKALVDEFAEAFGAGFDSSLHTVTHTLSAGRVKLSGFVLNIVPSQDAFDIEIPDFHAVYIHMLGHDCHSIVAGAKHADGMIAQLKDFIARGFELILSSHYTPEDLLDARTKIDYLNTVKTLAASSPNADAFKKSVRQRYPIYSGGNYLDMTASFFFAA